MRTLIDGYNLMHAAGLMRPRFGPGGLDKARGALLGLIAGALGEAAGDVTVVFDAREPPKGQPREAVIDRIKVLFASAYESADELIEQLIRADSGPKTLVLVSDDARLRQAATRRRARPVDCETFLRELESRRARLAAARRGSSATAPTRQRHGAAARGESRSPTAETKPSGRRDPDRDRWLREFAERINPDELAELEGPDWEALLGEIDPEAGRRR